MKLETIYLKELALTLAALDDNIKEMTLALAALDDDMKELIKTLQRETLNKENHNEKE